MSIEAKIRKDLQLNEYEETIFSKIDWKNCPKHIAIIMDGNGRWAKSQGKPRTYGHKKGVDSIHSIVELCGKIPVEYVTFYAFSTENWKRTESEVSMLLGLFSSSLKKYLNQLSDQGVRINVIGDLSKMGPKIQKEFLDANEKTKSNTKICMNLALNYSGRADLTRVTKEIALEVSSGKLDLEKINEDYISQKLYTGFMPEPELMIRTSGENRLSNFMLWENAYSEFYFTDVHWPDFREVHLFEAILEYQNRNRKFGGLC
ncbi:MAG: isoprenyl transferase [Candidatus Cloacimonadota bacterium]|nr:MAG: isoprenyl transferase [Candidatus Cloacimonadota bacterium]